MVLRKLLMTLALWGLVTVPRAYAAAGIQVGTSGKTYTSATVACAVNPTTGLLSPMIEAGLVNPARKSEGIVSLNGTPMGTVTLTQPTFTLWMPDGTDVVAINLSKKLTDTFTFSVTPGMCLTAANTFSADGTLEYGASGKSYATVAPGCALNPTTGLAQPYINLFDSGSYLLNVSVNGIPLTQLSSTNPHTPVFLSAGSNMITAVNGTLSTDTYVRDGSIGSCTL